jgi:hypothetical protein
MSVQLPHRPQNLEDFPDHFYRIEFKRVDGEAYRDHWAEWYPYLKEPMTVWEWLRRSGKQPFGQAHEDSRAVSLSAYTLNPAGFLYPDSTDSIRAAPRQHWLRYEDQNIRLLEVMYRAGEQGDAMHGHPYASVFAMDAPFDGEITDEHLDLDKAKTEAMGRGAAPAGMQFPTCSTMGPQSPNRPFNHSKLPLHFYRIEFKRLDGAGIKAHWREWYPWMAKQAGSELAH